MKKWIKIGAHCGIRGEGGRIYTIGALDSNSRTAAMFDADKYFHGWEAWTSLYRTSKARELDKMKAQNPTKIYFQPIKRKTCVCGQKKTEVCSMGDYVRGKYRNANYCCPHCWADNVKRYELEKYELTARAGYCLPFWVNVNIKCGHEDCVKNPEMGKECVRRS